MDVGLLDMSWLTTLEPTYVYAPEATRSVLDREAPGIAEAMRFPHVLSLLAGRPAELRP
jgi:hypothetical protein